MIFKKGDIVRLDGHIIYVVIHPGNNSSKIRLIYDTNNNFEYNIRIISEFTDIWALNSILYIVDEAAKKELFNKIIHNVSIVLDVIRLKITNRELDSPFDKPFHFIKEALKILEEI